MTGRLRTPKPLFFSAKYEAQGTVYCILGRSDRDGDYALIVLGSGRLERAIKGLRA